MSHTADGRLHSDMTRRRGRPARLPPGVDPADALDAVVSLYDTISDPGRWPSFLDRLAHIAGARHAISGVTDFTQPEVQFNVGDTSFGPDKLSKFFEIAAMHHSDGAAALMDRAPQSIVHDREIWPDRLAYRDRPLIRHLRESHGVERLVAANANPNRSWFDYLVLMYADDPDEIDHDQTDAIRFFLPHIAKANAARRPLELLSRRYRAVFGALDHLAFGVILADASGAVIARNLAAEALLDEADAIRIRNGCVGGSGDDGEATVSRLIAEAVAAARRKDVHLVGAGLAPRRSGGPPLVLDAAPFRDDANGELGAPICGALLFVIDPGDRALLSTDAVALAYALTPAESSVCAPLLGGAANDEIAERLDIAVSTVKTHVRSILAKTYTSDRNDLLRLSVSMTLPVRGD